MNIHGLKLKYKCKVENIKHLESEITKEERKPRREIDRIKIEKIKRMIDNIIKSKKRLRNQIKNLKKDVKKKKEILPQL